LKAVDKAGVVGGKGVRETNGKDWMNQNKVYPQQGYIEEHLWSST
jgi:hypothetical protein